MCKSLWMVKDVLCFMLIVDAVICPMAVLISKNYTGLQLFHILILSSKYYSVRSLLP